MKNWTWNSLLDPDLILKYLFLFGMAMMMAAMPLSEFFMSFSQFWLVGVFVLDGLDRDDIARHFRKKRSFIILWMLPMVVKWTLVSVYGKFRLFFSPRNAPALIFASIYLLHLVGLAYSHDLSYAMKDLRIKFPIFLLPLVLSTTGTVTRAQFRTLTYFLLGAIAFGTLVSTAVFLKGNYSDIRQTSVFISHIRFGLLICIGTLMMAYYILREQEIGRGWKLFFALAASWFVGYMVMVTSMTGLSTLILTTSLLLLILAFRHTNRIARAAFLTFLMLATVLIFIFIRSVVRDVYKIDHSEKENLEKATARGNPYWHEYDDPTTENGHFVWLYINENELREVWNSKSRFPYDGKDLKHQDVKYTLIRFLSSKGYRKDAEGVAKLTDEEVRMVEEGVANIIYRQKPAFYVRVYKIIWEYQIYQLTGNASGHSVMQRYEFIKTSLGIIKDNLLIGVGTGNPDIAFRQQYEKMGTLLDKKFQLRSHNQFLAFAIAFGLAGLLWFLLSLVLPPLMLNKYSDFFYLSFFIIITLSMLTEDTLETQAGVTIYAFFSSFYLFLKKFKDPI
jgi:hypothetical protein